MMPALKNTFVFLGDDIIDKTRENESLKDEKGSCDYKWLEKFTAETCKTVF